MPADDLRVIVGTEDVSDKIQDLTFSSVDPGGFEIADFSFPRNVPLKRGLDVRIESKMDIAWMGRVSEVQRSLAGSPSTRVACEGYKALLSESDMIEVYVDRDLSQWQDMPRFETKVHADLSRSLYASQVNADSTEPSVETTLEGAWTTLGICEAWYVAHPDQRLGTICYKWTRTTPVDNTSASWSWGVRYYLNETAISDNSSLRAAGPDADVVTLTGGGNSLALQQFFNGTGGAAGTTYSLFWSYIVVYGASGVPIRGDLETDSTGTTGVDIQRGVWASDVAKHALTKVGSLSSGIMGDASGFTIPQLAYREYTPVLQVVEDAAKFVGWHWGVWEPSGGLTGVDRNPRLDFRQRPETPTCWVSRENCDSLEVSERLENLYDRARVNYQDSAGAARAASASRQNSELDAIGEHRTLSLDGGIMGSTAAGQFADFALRLSAVLGSAAGSCEIPGKVMTATGTKPAYLIRPGIDRLRITDYPNTGLGDAKDFHVKRMECSVTADGYRTSVEMGTGADLLEVLQSRLGVAAELQ